MFLVLLIIFSFPLPILTNYLDPDYYKCDDNCYFYDDIITVQTVKSWPSNCSIACGTIHLTEASAKVSTEKLAKVFEKLFILKGAIIIENTAYTNLSFLSNNLYIYCTTDTIIRNNSELVDASSMLNWRQAEEDTCPFRVTGNPKLDTRRFCDSQNYEKTLNWMVYDNGQDCACTGGNIDWKSVSKYSNCENITGRLVISNMKSEIPDLSKLKYLNGYLEVHGTSLQNLSYLGNLEKIVSSFMFVEDHMYYLDIHDNPKMTRLGLRGLKNLTNVNWSPYMVSFRNLHPDFCLTVGEVSLFLDFNARFLFIDAHYCPELGWNTSANPKTCAFYKMSKLDTGCVYIIGNVFVDSGDEEYVEKLKEVKRIFGTIAIRNTMLENANFLSKLERIVRLNGSDSETMMMLFLDNKRLQNLQFPNIKSFWANSNKEIILKGNHADVFKRTRHCLVLQYLTGAKVNYNGRNCISINKTLPSDVGGFDFYSGVDYDQYTDRYDWWDEYDGDFYYIDTTAYDNLFNALGYVNTITAIIGLLINIINLTVLLQRELRTIFIFIVMIAISICEIQLVTPFILQFLFNHNLIYTMNTCNDHTYYHILFNLLKNPIQSMARRCSAFLAVLMAVFRTLFVVFPVNNTVAKLSRPKAACLMIVGFFGICFVWDFILVAKCTIYATGHAMCKDDPIGFTPYNYTCPTDDKYDDFSIPIYKIISLLDGFSAVFTALFHSIITILLIYYLRKAQKVSKSMTKEKSENTLMLVTVMSMSFFISEMLYGASYIFEQLIFAYFDRLKQLSESARIVVWTCLIINSSVHCLICFFMSTQYRKVARKVFCCKGEKKTSVVAVASITTIKSFNGSTSGTFRSSLRRRIPFMTMVN